MPTPASWNGLRTWLLIALLLASVPVMAVAAHATSQTSADASDEPRGSWAPEPDARFLDIAFDPAVLRVAAGHAGTFDVVVRNDGAQTERVALRPASVPDLDLWLGERAELDLAPGETARFTLWVHVSPAAMGRYLVHLDALDADGRATHTAWAEVDVDRPFVELPIAPARPFPLPIELIEVSPPIVCAHVVPGIPPGWGPLGPECAPPAPPACPRPAPVVRQADGTLLLTLLLKGRVVDGQLVVDLTPEMEALLAA